MALLVIIFTQDLFERFLKTNVYRGWTQTDYQNKHYNINQKDEGTWDDQGRDGGTNFILRIK